MKATLNTAKFFVRLADQGARCRKTHLVLIPLIVVLLATSVVAGTITGTVNGPDGQPLTGVSINVNVLSGDPCGQYSGVNGAGINTEDGTYTISNIPAGTYFLNTWNNNTGYYTDEWWDGSLSSPDCHSAQTITISAEETLAGRDFQLTIGGTISGTIYSSEGTTPITGQSQIGANVWIGDDPCDAQHFKGTGINPADGTFILAGLPPGNYYMRTWVNGPAYLGEYWASSASTTNCSEAQQITVVAGQTETGKNFQLDPGATISGHVTGNYGDTVCLSAHTLINGDTCDLSQWAGGANIGINGDFSFVVPAGTYLMYFNTVCGSNPNNLLPEYWTADDAGTTDCTQAATFTVAVGEETTKNITLDQQGGKITGTVSDENGVINGDLYDMGINAYTGDACDNHVQVSGSRLANDGSYSVTLPLAGQYILGIWSNGSPYLEEWFTGFDGEGNPTSSRNCQEAVHLSFSQGQDLIENAHFNLEKGGRITGTVADVNGVINGDLYDMGVNAYTGDACDNHVQVSGSRLANDGSYSVTLPLAGQYILGVWSNESPYLEEWFAGFDGEGNPMSSRSCQDAVPLSFAQGQDLIENAGFTLEKGGRITGTVSDENGAVNGDQYNMGVNVFTGEACGNNQHVRGSGLENDGTYSVTVPLDGQYLLRIYSNDTPYVEKWFAGFDNEGNPTTSYTCGDAAHLSFTQGQELIEHADFNLEKGGKISGFVYEQGGMTPLTGETSNVRVDAFSGPPCNNNYVGGGNVNMADGSYLTSALPPGNVYIKVNHTTVHSDPWWTASGITEECEVASPIAVTSAVTTSGINFSLPKDSDGDGLTDTDEDNVYHTDKTKTDSDGDGIPDDGEVYLWGDAYSGDIDGDGVWNIAETDADNDGISDLREFARGTDLKDPASTPPPLTLYDDFSSGNLDAEKWLPEEYQMATKDGALQLFVNSPATYRQSAQTPAKASQNIKATFTVNEAARNDGGSVYFNVHGVYYHENTDPGPQTGRVYASMAVGDAGTGLQASYYIGRIIDETGQMAAVKSGSVNTPALTIGTSYKMEIRYDGTNGFTFNLLNNAGELLGTAADTGNAFGAPLTDRRGLQVSVLDKGGKIGVSVDTFETGNGAEAYTEYDRFELPLNASRWATPEIAKMVADDDKLHLLSHSYGNQLSTRSYVKHRFNYIEGKVKIDSRSFQTGASRGRARLDGFLYNDSRGPNSSLPYNGNEGNVYGQVVIDYTESRGLFATVWVERINDRDWTSSEELISNELSIPLFFDTEYVLYIGFAGDYLIAGIDSADGTQHAMDATEIETPKYLPFNPLMELLARQVGNGTEGMMSAYFDDIKVSGDFLEKPGDLNVDGYVDLTDAILGLQTMAGSDNGKTWSAGDMNGDGVVGMPEVINAMKQVSGD